MDKTDGEKTDILTIDIDTAKPSGDGGFRADTRLFLQIMMVRKDQARVGSSPRCDSRPRSPKPHVRVMPYTTAYGTPP